MNQNKLVLQNHEAGENDDVQLGHILSRREILSLFGFAGGALLIASCVPATQSTVPPVNAESATAVAMVDNPTAEAVASEEVATVSAVNTAVPNCIVRPEVTEGPYYVDEALVRSDVRSDPSTGEVKEGAPLVLTFAVSQVSDNACVALAGAEVEIWHCDAAGVYSDVADPGFDSTGQKWLRGSQITDANGSATFTTIYPGWYSGRAVHIHFKVRPDANSVFTSQLFFDDAFSDQVFTHAPYAGKGQRNTFNSNDNIYQELLLLTTTTTSSGYVATFPIGIDISTLGTGEQSGGPPDRTPRSGG